MHKNESGYRVVVMWYTYSDEMIGQSRSEFSNIFYVYLCCMVPAHSIWMWYNIIIYDTGPRTGVQTLDIGTPMRACIVTTVLFFV